MNPPLLAGSGCTRILTILAAIVAAATCCSAATCSSESLKALLEFRKEFIDPSGKVFSTWNETVSDCCAWKGLTCQNEMLVVLDVEGPSGTGSDFVTSNKSYSSKPGHSLSKLKDLQTLRLKNILFSSKIPSQWSSFSDSLVELTVNNCDLQGSIPSGLASNIHLKSLDLMSNNLKGGIPSKLCNLKELKYLDLSYNELNTSTVPDCMTSGRGYTMNVSYGHQSHNSGTGSPQSAPSGGGSASSPSSYGTSGGGATILDKSKDNALLLSAVASIAIYCLVWAALHSCALPQIPTILSHSLYNLWHHTVIWTSANSVWSRVEVPRWRSRWISALHSYFCDLYSVHVKKLELAAFAAHLEVPFKECVMRGLIED